MPHEVESANGNGAHAPVSSRKSSESPPPPPDGGWGWVVVFASFMIHIVIDGLTYSFGVLYYEFLVYFQEGESKTAWIVSILCAITLSSGPLTGSMVNRWGCRLVTILGGVLAAACIIASAFANNVLMLILTIGVGAGFGCGLIYLPAIVSVTVWFERYRSLATGIAVCGSGLGTFIFPHLTKGLISSYGWRGALVIIGALILNCIPLGFLFLPVPEVPRSPASEPMLTKQKKSALKKSQSTEHMDRANGHKEEGDVARMTLSQPALNKSHESKQQPHSRHGSGIMHRPDVLYQGSMASLTKCRASSPERIQIMTKDEETESPLSKMLDVTLLVDPIFVLFSVSNILTNIGFYIPYVYTVIMSSKLGVENPERLISIMGATTLIGRIVLGFVSDKPWVNRLVVYNVCLATAGISMAFAAACTEFWGLAMYAATYGFTSGAYVGLTSVVLVDLFGMEKLTNAFGLLLFFQGIASLFGAPLAGWLIQATGSYTPTFIGAGAFVSISGLMLFVVPLIQRRRRTSAMRVRSSQDLALDHM
ncbi:monocarboxylate transporter 12-like [Leguminivora glycinivorella]|uniref:monocarboxylate transporter 12-like n=1 Tax=Leguminivora glycinivorella TaxID=1035111 RepID=UPI00200DA2EC|nr:monocarboxylate transporter 12-like [Leguminivora glycinivorella]